MCRDITQQLRDRARTKTQGCLVLSCSLLSERGVMKTSHPSIQGTFGSYFHWCHILEAASSHIILPSQPQMLQCVYSFLELGGGAGDPKQTDQPKTTTRKLGVEPSKGTKREGERVCTEGSFGATCVQGHLAWFPQGKALWLL